MCWGRDTGPRREVCDRRSPVTPITGRFLASLQKNSPEPIIGDEKLLSRRKNMEKRVDSQCPKLVISALSVLVQVGLSGVGTIARLGLVPLALIARPIGGAVSFALLKAGVCRVAGGAQDGVGCPLASMGAWERAGVSRQALCARKAQLVLFRRSCLFEVMGCEARSVPACFVHMFGLPLPILRGAILGRSRGSGSVTTGAGMVFAPGRSHAACDLVVSDGRRVVASVWMWGGVA